MLTDTLAPAAAPSPMRRLHPMDSSRLLLSLLNLAADSAHASAQYNDRYLECVAAPTTLRRLLSALAYRDDATLMHSRRVALVAVGIARYLGWDESPLRKLEVAALLHDLGKLGIPDHILHKPARLSPDEQEFVLLHHYIGVDLLQACRIDPDIVEMVWSAHAHGRTSGDDAYNARGCISQGGRLLAVADAYDSLRNDQTYRKGKQHDEAMRILNEQSGKDYDRNVVAALNRWLREQGQGFLAAEGERGLAESLTASVDAETIAQAGELSHAFAFLYQLETMYDGFCLVDADHRFVIWSHGMEQVTGLKAQQMLGETWERNLLAFFDQKRGVLRERECPVQRSFLTGVTHCQSLQLLHRHSNRWLEVEVQALPLVGQEGLTQGTALLLRDTAAARETGHYQALQLAVRRDPLTGVGNRAELEGRLTRLFQTRSETSEEIPFAVIFLDLDHFKGINDTLGHTVGDRVLVNLARLVSDELYSGETVCRYGGEEFVILCPETDLQAAVSRAERLRNVVEGADLASLNDHRVTASFGVAQVEPGDTIETLLKRADEALYEAKRTGRNRTCSRSTDRRQVHAMAACDSPSPPAAAPYVQSAVFQARFAEEMVQHKLAGFIADCGARLVSVKPSLLELRLGRGGLFGGWGQVPQKQPVKLVLDMSTPTRMGRWAAQHLTIKATVTPLGRCGREQVFRARAHQVLRDLRAYFAANE